jgi:hypothetical protein
MATIGATSLQWLHVGLANSNAGLDVLGQENIEYKDVIFNQNHIPSGVDGQGGIESYRGGWRDDQVRFRILFKGILQLPSTNFTFLTAFPDQITIITASL